MRDALREAMTQKVVVDRATERLVAAVSAAREDGASWAEVGEALDMQRSTARSVFEPRVRRYREERR